MRNSCIAAVLVLACQREAATHARPRDGAVVDVARRDASPADVTPDAPVVPVRRCASWRVLGEGVAVRRCAPGAGHVAVLLAGWRITLASTEAWAEALDARRLAALGVTTLYAVQGPADVDFRRKTLGVDALLADLRASVRGEAWVLLAAHSSGAHVAATLLRRAARAVDGGGLRGRAVYVDLDGDRGIAGDPERNLDDDGVALLRRVIFVTPDDPARGLHGYSRAAMEDGHRRFAATSELLRYDTSASGCATDDCAHLALINTRPSPRGNASYARYDTGAVNTAWVTAAEPWLTARRETVLPSAR